MIRSRQLFAYLSECFACVLALSPIILLWASQRKTPGERDDKESTVLQKNAFALRVDYFASAV